MKQEDTKETSLPAGHGDTVGQPSAKVGATTDEATQPPHHDEYTVSTSGSSANESVKVIGWDGDDDPENPKNFPFKRRWFITSVIRWVPAKISLLMSSPRAYLPLQSLRYPIANVFLHDCALHSGYKH